MKAVSSTCWFRCRRELSRTRLLPTSLKGLSCLIVDDNLTNRRILHAITTQWSMKSDAVESAVLALSALEAAASGNNAYKLVLIDGHMPQMDGFQLAERIRRNPKLTGAIVLMLTSGGQPGDIDRCRELGISAYLIKPIRRSELLDVVLRVLNKAPREVITDSEEALLPNAAARTLRFLAAEDNFVNQRLIVRLLESVGHSVTVVGDGLAAVNASQQNSYDVILMDVQMPIMDGHEATRQIRHLERTTGAHVPIIAMTAHAMKGDREKCLEAGMDDYIAKPLHKQELLQAICEQTTRKRLPLGEAPAPIFRSDFFKRRTRYRSGPAPNGRGRRSVLRTLPPLSPGESGSARLCTKRFSPKRQHGRLSRSSQTEGNRFHHRWPQSHPGGTRAGGTWTGRRHEWLRRGGRVSWSAR